jgi:hypothetical protein
MRSTGKKGNQAYECYRYELKRDEQGSANFSFHPDGALNYFLHGGFPSDYGG